MVIYPLPGLLDRVFFFFFNDTAPTEIYTLPLHDALPIYSKNRSGRGSARSAWSARCRSPLRCGGKPMKVNVPASRPLTERSAVIADGPGTGVTRCPA